MEKKRSIFAAAILMAVFGTAAVYIGFYRLPAVRFAHRIFPLIYRSETVSEYRKDGYAIRVEDGLPQSTVQFLSPDGARQTFFVSQEGYEVTAAQSEPLLSGIWQGGQLRGSDGKKLPEYQEMELHAASDTFVPSPAAAIYIYKTHAASMRGGKRAPLMLAMAIVLWLIFLAELDTRPGFGRKRFEYRNAMLNDYGKAEESPTTREVARIIGVSAGIFAVACVCILLYDILCY